MSRKYPTPLFPPSLHSVSAAQPGGLFTLNAPKLQVTCSPLLTPAGKLPAMPSNALRAAAANLQARLGAGHQVQVTGGTAGQPAKFSVAFPRIPCT